MPSSFESESHSKGSRVETEFFTEKAAATHLWKEDIPIINQPFSYLTVETGCTCSTRETVIRKDIILEVCPKLVSWPNRGGNVMFVYPRQKPDDDRCL